MNIKCRCSKAQRPSVHSNHAKAVLDIHSAHHSKSTDLYHQLTNEAKTNNAVSLVKLNNFISNENQSHDKLVSFKSNGCRTNLKRISLHEIRSLKDKTRLMRRQTSYNSMSEEPTLRFNESKESKLS